MVVEWYSDFTIFLKLGPFILATYGLFVGISCMTFTWTSLAYLKAFEKLQIFSLADDLKAPIVAITTLMLMIGWRLCSMFLEDKHELDKGNYIRALLRPGFLEAGGHTFLTCYGILLGLYFSLTSGQPLSLLSLLTPMCCLVDAMNIGYTTVMWLLSLGCVTYGCCWGKEVPAGTWYATVYTNPGAKALRIKPELKGKSLFPHTTLRGFLFMKNGARSTPPVRCIHEGGSPLVLPMPPLYCSPPQLLYMHLRHDVLMPVSIACFCPGVILSILGTFFYVPGLFTVIYPMLNRKDKDIYYSKRGDAGEDLVGYCAEENFYMVRNRAAHALHRFLCLAHFLLTTTRASARNQRTPP